MIAASSLRDSRRRTAGAGVVDARFAVGHIDIEDVCRRAADRLELIAHHLAILAVGDAAGSADADRGEKLQSRGVVNQCVRAVSDVCAAVLASLHGTLRVDGRSVVEAVQIGNDRSDRGAIAGGFLQGQDVERLNVAPDIFLADSFENLIQTGAGVVTPLTSASML